MNKTVLEKIQAHEQEQIEAHYNALVVAPRLQRNKLPEALFVSIFLPYFCGDFPIEQNPDMIAKWIGIAGTPMQEVDIIDSDGTVLFTVPAFVDSGVVNALTERDNQSFSSIIANFNLYKNITPIVGKNYLDTSVKDKLSALTQSSPTYTENAKRWNAIFVRYGKAKSETSVEAPDNNKLHQDEFFYD